MSKNLNVSVLMDYYVGLLTEKQRSLAELYYNDDLSLGEIAELTGITRQGVHDSIKRTEALLMDAEKNMGLVQRLSAMAKTMQQVEQATKELVESCQEHNCPNTIIEQLEDLHRLADDYLSRYE